MGPEAVADAVAVEQRGIDPEWQRGRDEQRRPGQRIEDDLARSPRRLAAFGKLGIALDQ